LLRTSKTSVLLYQFRSQVQDVYPRPVDFDIARREIDALTVHYRPALELARSLVLQLDPDLFDAGPGRMVGFELDMPRLFEAFVHRLIEAALPDCRVVSQTVDGEAFIDDWGKTYRTIRPDTVVFDEEAPLAVFDAKYKPRYLRDGKKVSTADLYQLFFYQSRLRERGGLKEPPIAAIVAPSFGTSPPARSRIIHRAAENQPAKIRLVDLPLERVVRQLRYGENAALDAAPELATLLASIVEERRRSSSATNKNSVILRAV
jgi:5-methylcytosine-specific restriction endonuclease McrBC regulatory subunit McrC